MSSKEGEPGNKATIDFLLYFIFFSSAVGEDNFEWLHHQRVSGCVDPAR